MLPEIPSGPEWFTTGTDARECVLVEGVQRVCSGNASGQMIGFTFTSGVGQMRVVREPEEIGVGEGSGIKFDVVDGLSGKKKSE